MSAASIPVKVAILVKAMTKRNFIELRRYMFDTISGLVTLYLFFLVIFFGARALIGGAPASGETLSGIVVGFMVWMLAIFAYSEIAFDLAREASEGTLEQLSMAPLGLPTVLVVRFLSAIAFQLVILIALLFMMMATSGKWLHLNFGSVLPLLFVTVIGVHGFGFIMGGLAIVFKRVQSALQIIQFVFPAMIAAPLDKFPVLKFLPLSWGNRLIFQVMIEDRSILDMPPGDLAFLVANSLCWLAVGVGVFKYFERIARSRGLLAHY